MSQEIRETHAWGGFLREREKWIRLLKDKFGFTYLEIARRLCMEEKKVISIYNKKLIEEK